MSHLSFKNEMIRAIQAGAKTQTRRICAVQPNVTTANDAAFRDAKADLWRNAEQYARDCSRFTVGQEVWVKEALYKNTRGFAAYQADSLTVLVDRSGDIMPHRWSYKPAMLAAMYCPRWASRITLIITGVRVERLQAIGKDGRKAKDVLAEGITREQIGHMQTIFHPDDSPALAYAQLWNEINGKKYPWVSNPWVFVYEFKVKGVQP